MLLIYSTETSARLQYICKFIFEETLKTSFSITLHPESFEKHEGPKINYSREVHENTLQIMPHTLLFEKNITEQNIECEGTGEQAVFFQLDSGYPFDIFAAAFYLISRYEEYLPHELDMYGRYAHENSLAYRNNFLNIPLVNIWLHGFKWKLFEVFPSLVFQQSDFKFIPTYDIDIAWSYKEKGFLRNAAGFLRSPSIGRITALLGMKEDPYDGYQYLHELHSLNRLSPIYFFLVAKENSLYDKNILPQNTALQALIKEHAAKYQTGLHPSWKSNSTEAILKEEKATLEQITGGTISLSRQHYIKFALPQTYERLLAAGITDDYSMGYGSINGFRASTASPYLWYDLSKEKITALRVQPFCFMDANCFYEQKLNTEESYKEIMHYYFACKQVSGTLITIFHNNFLGTDKKFAGWRELYSKFISQAQ
jgi:hypothetical protein